MVNPSINEREPRIERLQLIALAGLMLIGTAFVFSATTGRGQKGIFSIGSDGQDVVALKPATVLILAGTNDIAGNTGPMRLEDIEANYASMADIARANNIRLVFSSVLPVHNYTPQSQNLFAGRPPEKILELNRWLKNHCASNPAGCLYLDYFTAMVDDKGFMKKELADDGLHPNAAGYKIMAPLAQAAIEKALAPTAKTVKAGKK